MATKLLLLVFLLASNLIFANGNIDKFLYNAKVIVDKNDDKDLKKSPIMISPNKGYSEIYIEWVNQTFNIEIFNLQGILINTYFDLFSNATISLRDLAKGTYLLKIVDKTTCDSKVVKFLKN